MAFELLEGVTPFGEIGGGMQKGGAEIPFIAAPVSDALKFTIFKMLSKETWDRPTAATLVEWANNPSAIEVDYDLLTDDDDATLQYPETPVVNEVPAGRETQRFGTSSMPNDTNATVAFGSAVSEELTISVNPQEIYVPAEGGNSIVYVNTNGEWTLPKATTQDWIRISKYSDSAFIVKFDKNNTGKDRAYTIVVPSVSNNKKAFANIAVKQPTLKSKAWIWWLLGIIIVVILSVSISNAVEQNRIRQQHIEQENARKTRVKNEYAGLISTCEANLKSASTKNIQPLLSARTNVQRMKQIEANNHWLVARSTEMDTKVENKCVEIYNKLNESSSKLAAKANNGVLNFNDVHTQIYDLLDKQCKLFPTEELKKVRDSWK